MIWSEKIVKELLKITTTTKKVLKKPKKDHLNGLIFINFIYMILLRSCRFQWFILKDPL